MTNLHHLRNEQERLQDGSRERHGILEELLLDGLRRVVREEIRAALVERGHEPDEPKATTYLSVAEAARIAQLHHGTLREWIKDGSLRAFRAGRVYRIRREDLDARLTCKVADPVSSEVSGRVAAILARRRLRAA
jgi:excisionase family DNA binding protein